VRQWFTALDIERDVASGRQIVERVLAREGRTAIPFDAVAQRLGLADARALFLAMAREEVGPRALEDAVRNYLRAEPPVAPTQTAPSTAPAPAP
jgi:GTP pyrophosphokinase